MTWWIRSFLTISCLTLLAPMAQAQIFHHKHTHHGYYTPPAFLVSGQALPSGVQAHAFSYSPVQVHSFYASPMSDANAQAQLNWLNLTQNAARLFCKTFGDSGSTTNTDLDRRLKAIEDRLKALEGIGGTTPAPGEIGKGKEFPGASALATTPAPRDALKAARDQTFLAAMRHKLEYQNSAAAVDELIRYYTEERARIETYKPK